MKRICKQCGKDIDLRHFNARYCSMRCKDKTKRLKNFVPLTKLERSVINTKSSRMRTEEGNKKISESYLKTLANPIKRALYNEKIQKSLEGKICDKCGKIYKAKNHRQRYCGSLNGKNGCCWEQRKERNLDSWYKNEYGISFEDFKVLSTKQGDVCNICGKKELERRQLLVDHDHKTGKIRGLLCGKCNRGLGHFQDNILLLQSAIEYLQKE